MKPIHSDSTMPTPPTRPTGRVALAATMIGLGMFGLISGTFPPIWSGVPEGFPAHDALVYLCALVALGSGAGLLVRRTALTAARVLLGYLVIWLLLFRVPLVVQNPTSSGVWWAAGSTAVMIAGAWALLARDASLRGVGVLFGLGLIPFGIAHFTFWQRTVSLVPAWLPWHEAWAGYTGLAFILAGLAIVAGVYTRLAATLVLAQLAGFTLLVWVPIVLGHPTASDWSEFIESLTLIAGAWAVADAFREMAWLPSRPQTRVVVVGAWLLAGTLDISTAIFYYVGPSTPRVTRLLQGIASGLLGRAAFDGGTATALLGLALHYLIALIWTLVFLIAFRALGFLRRSLAATGVAYGITVWIVMTFVVLPLSNHSRAPFQLRGAVIAAVILILCIGLPISLVLGRHLRPESGARVPDETPARSPAIVLSEP
jgi:uncharacterized membrane protein